MKKTTHNPRRRVPPVALIPTPDPKVAKAAARDGMLAAFCADFSASMWDTRDPANKMGRSVGHAAERLTGLSEICWSLTWCDLSKSGRKSADDPMPPGFETHRYLAQALGDLGKVLKAAHDLWWDSIQAEDETQRQRRELARQRRAQA